MNRFRMFATVVALAMVSGFGAGAHAQDNSVIKGKIVFKGNPEDEKFKRTVIDTSKDDHCTKKIGTEKVVINKDSMTLQNVLVSVKEGLGEKKYAAPTEPVTIDQEGCQYKPHVFGLMEGQTLKIKNSDDTNHNIHFQPKKNEELNFSQPKKDMEKDVKLVAEDVFGVKCDVHPWMGAFIGVFTHPFFSVSGKEGTFEIKGLPPGKYVIRAWHETLGEQTATVEVKSGETKEQGFTFEGK